MKISIHDILRSIESSKADYSGLNNLEIVAAEKILDSDNFQYSTNVGINWKYLDISKRKKNF